MGCEGGPVPYIRVNLAVGRVVAFWVRGAELKPWLGTVVGRSRWRRVMERVPERWIRWRRIMVGWVLRIAKHARRRVGMVWRVSGCVWVGGVSAVGHRGVVGSSRVVGAGMAVCVAVLRVGDGRSARSRRLGCLVSPRASGRREPKRWSRTSRSTCCPWRQPLHQRRARRRDHPLH